MFNTISGFAIQSELSVSCSDSVNIGRSFDITFSMNHNTDVRAIQFNAFYDSRYLSFKGVSAVQSGDVDYYDKDGKVGIIFLKSSVIEKGEVIKLSFTAKTGNSSSKQKISFEFLEAVDNNLNNASVGITDSITINIIKSSDSSQSNGGSTKSNNSSSSKSTSSKSSTSSKAIASNSVSEKNYSGENRSFYENEEEYDNPNYDEEVADWSGFHRIDELSESGDSIRYVMLGAGGMLAVVMVGIICYRLGKGRSNDVSKEEYIPEMEMMFRKHWDKNDEDEL